MQIEIKIEGPDLVIRLLDWDDMGPFEAGSGSIPLMKLAEAVLTEAVKTAITEPSAAEETMTQVQLTTEEKTAWREEMNRRQPVLQAAFELVQPKTHWKAPIDAVVPFEADLALIAEAVVHFTATEATFSKVPEGWRVRASGYWAGPAGDH